MPGFRNSLICFLSASGTGSVQGVHPSCLHHRPGTNEVGWGQGGAVYPDLDVD